MFFFANSFAQDKINQYLKLIPPDYFFFSTSELTNSQSKLDYVVDSNYSVDQKTCIIQGFIDNNDLVLLPNKEIVVSKKGLNIESNKTIVFQKNTILRMHPNALEHYGAINIINANNVKVLNANIIGDRNTHLSDKGEWGHGIRILGSTNVEISNFLISNSWGDGIYIGRNDNRVSRSITLKNGVVINNRRNGISVTSVEGLKMENVTAAFSNGTNPQFGIDFEANGGADQMDNIFLNNVKTYKNTNGGMMISFYKMAKSGQQLMNRNVRFNINNFSDIGSKDYGVLIAEIHGFNSLSGWIKINGLEVEQNIRPIIIRRNMFQNFVIELNDVNIANPTNKNFHNRELVRVLQNRSNIKIKVKDE